MSTPVIQNITYRTDSSGNQLVEWDEVTTNHVVRLASDVQDDINAANALVTQLTPILQAVPVSTPVQPVGP